ncbi:hypothetical protein GCK32_020094 [Trichostrongylus colubriformis]|uniref:Uncharacterized protein n=1 Tax=Trichostrongylus colubriformis TaxID=6319 RepID=A0AAN8FC50_TRICO
MSYTMDRVASVEQLASALRRYLFAAVHWIEALFSLAQIENVPEKVAVLKSVFAPYTILCQAARTAQLSRDVDVICLCNRTTITRQPPRHLLETKSVKLYFLCDLSCYNIVNFVHHCVLYMYIHLLIHI